MIFFFSPNKAILELKSQKWTKKATFFCQSCHPCFDHFGLKKVDFLTFSKLFWCSFRSVWALFLNLEGPLLVVFSARKVDKWLEKSRFVVQILPMIWQFSPILGVKKFGFWNFSKLFWNSLRSVWELFLDFEGPMLDVFSARKVDKWFGKWDFLSKFGQWYSHFQHFRGSRK